MKLENITLNDVDLAMSIINEGKKHLKEQGIDQWQDGYPDYECIKQDAIHQRGYFIKDDDIVMGYVCVDFNGEPSYDTLKGEWASNDKYVVAHRLAFNAAARGKDLASKAFALIEEMSIEKGVHYFRVDTDGDNKKMQHILNKNGFTYRGIIFFDNSEKIAFDKEF